MIKRKVENFLMKLVIGVGIPFAAMVMHLKWDFLLSLIFAIY